MSAFPPSETRIEVRFSVDGPVTPLASPIPFISLSSPNCPHGTALAENLDARWHRSGGAVDIAFPQRDREREERGSQQRTVRFRVSEGRFQCI